LLNKILKFLFLIAIFVFSLRLIDDADIPLNVNAHEDFSYIEISNPLFTTLAQKNPASKKLEFIPDSFSKMVVDSIDQRSISELKTQLSGFKIDTADEFEQLIIQKCSEYGCSADQVIRVMYCESSGNQYANSGWYMGLFQQDKKFWPARAASYGHAGADIFDAYAQIEVATKMFSLGMGSHWGCK
jgi:hypothetical protein